MLTIQNRKQLFRNKTSIKHNISYTYHQLLNFLFRNGIRFYFSNGLTSKCSLNVNHSFSYYGSSTTKLPKPLGQLQSRRGMKQGSENLIKMLSNSSKSYLVGAQNFGRAVTNTISAKQSKVLEITRQMEKVVIKEQNLSLSNKKNLIGAIYSFYEF